ncbi:MAG: hypothetical protein MJZ28_07845 [Paludibacteraceae bacterium]|nr:hypothetical protein [Paludibacteraceae bacterium]
MIKLNSKIFLSILLLPLLLWNCKDEDFTTDSSYRLKLSVDTLSFDTIFTETLTATQRMMVYNETSKDIRIEKIRLESSVKCFQINVNGRSGDEFTNVELRSKDSMYIFVQAKLGELNQNAPMYILDSLVFLYNGNKQDVKLVTYGQDAHRLKSFTIEKDTSWTNDKPYLIFDTLKIAEGATLTIEKGTRLYLHNGAHIQINGRLEANGDFAHAPILFRGDRTDYIYGDIQYDRIVGQWDGISISKTSKGNVFNGCIIRSCNTAIRVDSAEIDPEVKRAVISNSWLHNTKSVALKATNANLYAYNTIISNALNANVLLQGGEYVFNHCSIVGVPKNSRYNSCVVLANFELYSATEELIPLNEANFTNCVIFGTFREELKLSGDKEKGAFNYVFRNCLLRSEKKELDVAYDSLHVQTDSNFVNNVWNEDPDFVMVDWDNYEFDFRLDNASAAKSKADNTLYRQFPECKNDIVGIDRVSKDSTDIGAFVWVEIKEEPEE